MCLLIKRSIKFLRISGLAIHDLLFKVWSQNWLLFIILIDNLSIQWIINDRLECKIVNKFLVFCLLLFAYTLIIIFDLLSLFFILIFNLIVLTNNVINTTSKFFKIVILQGTVRLAFCNHGHDIVYECKQMRIAH